MAKKVSDYIWQDILHKHIVDGIGCRQLAKDYGVPESTIRDRAKTAHSAQIKKVANQIVEIKHSLIDMPISAQTMTCALADKLSKISSLACDVAEMEAHNAKRLSALKSAQILNLDPELLDKESVFVTKLLGEMVNDALKPSFNLMSANKDFIEKVNAEESTEKQHTRIERVIVSAKNAVT